MKNKIGICLFTLLILFMTGCSKVVVKSDSDPNVDMTKLKSFYVQKLAADGRGIEKKIAAKVSIPRQSRGL